jgi:hypothetical protein
MSLENEQGINPVRTKTWIDYSIRDEPRFQERGSAVTEDVPHVPSYWPYEFYLKHTMHLQYQNILSAWRPEILQQYELSGHFRTKKSEQASMCTFPTLSDPHYIMLVILLWHAD